MEIAYAPTFCEQWPGEKINQVRYVHQHGDKMFSGATAIPYGFRSVSNTDLSPSRHEGHGHDAFRRLIDVSSSMRRASSVPGNVGVERQSESNQTSHLLWRSNQEEFNKIRTDLLKIKNSQSREFSIEPKGKFLATGSVTPPPHHTQPTSSSCNVTAFFSATNDILPEPFDSRKTALEKFISLIDGEEISQEEKSRFFTGGMSVSELADLANKIFKSTGVAWTATAVRSGNISTQELKNIIKNENNDRLLINFGTSSLYNPPGNGGHFGHILGSKEVEGEMHIHLGETANYKYPEKPWIPLANLHRAMCQPSADGGSRGIVIIREVKPEFNIDKHPTSTGLRER
ncbi:hypothetical protein PI93_015530 [Pandoraea fibrosis]|uniref:Glutathione gamma-glutamylcysteinyltransferase n=1 Tax=Pandoraea fibrosis TaxID=1891094 RepID=A0ABX6HSK5_9BURK|nr:phytochelatin synthase family protein [Pandoraea fibrosis]QHE92547.1 hypothetical protein PJ20_012470 [Pandoraea fibrosis]QHF13897.1 hypothetical protein PI93_015530 [Pandoraea fibrosis]